VKTFIVDVISNIFENGGGFVWKGRNFVLVINEKDNVAVAMIDLFAGETVAVRGRSGLKEIQVLDNIPRGHKIAISEIKKGEPVIKYGEIIGFASTPIMKGSYVHNHNIVGRCGSCE